MLIFDLDDTIFETRSMNPQIFEPAIALIHDYYKGNNTNVEPEVVIADLWARPIDVVFSTYNTPSWVTTAFYDKISEIDYQDLNINTFEDYSAINVIQNRKILVTTGLRELQLAKVNALGITSDFEAIHIDDPRLNPRRHKIDIFQQILHETQKVPSEIWVIGDNPNSEIEAAKALGMHTILRKSHRKSSTIQADHEIDSFEELKNIIPTIS